MKTKILLPFFNLLFLTGITILSILLLTLWPGYFILALILKKKRSVAISRWYFNQIPILSEITNEEKKKSFQEIQK